MTNWMWFAVFCVFILVYELEGIKSHLRDIERGLKK